MVLKQYLPNDSSLLLVLYLAVFAHDKVLLESTPQQPGAADTGEHVRSHRLLVKLLSQAQKDFFYHQPAAKPLSSIRAA